jgi:hypothetical protein
MCRYLFCSVKFFLILSIVGEEDKSNKVKNFDGVNHLWRDS